MKSLDEFGSPMSEINVTPFVDVIEPSIAVTKTVTPATVLPGILVQYSYAVSNTGSVPLADVWLTDDTCASPDYVSGDVDRDGLLDVGELWTYVCSAVVYTDTTNVAIAVGRATDESGDPYPGIDPVSDDDTKLVTGLSLYRRHGGTTSARRASLVKSQIRLVRRMGIHGYCLFVFQYMTDDIIKMLRDEINAQNAVPYFRSAQ